MIYFIHCPARHVVKIGHGSNPATRLKAFQTGCPDPLHIITTIPGDLKEEQQWHARWSECRVRGEWFRYEGHLERAISDSRIVNGFNGLLGIESRLGDLIGDALAFRDYGGLFCQENTWYGTRGFPDFRRYLNRLVGMNAESRDWLLSGHAAYEMAYREIKEALPMCDHGCSCTADEQGDYKDWEYNGECKPVWFHDAKRRSGLRGTNYSGGAT